MQEEEARAGRQAKTGKTVNPKAKGAPRPKVRRVNKGFQVEESRAAQWDALVAKMKNDVSNKRSGPELIDEALDFLFKKYLND
ncbi:MAG: hypothetical protein GY947_10015 [Rhodobacteraceae bacterium]|nr:hypothetical protein [Paracoccaceae bacterium]